MQITKIIGGEPNKLAKEIDSSLEKQGISCFVSTPTSSSIKLQNCRLTDEYVRENGYNISPYSGRRGRVISWDNWVTVNNTINKVLDSHNVSANASSLHGLFQIRDGEKAFTEKDWESPIRRREAWASER